MTDRGQTNRTTDRMTVERDYRQRFVPPYIKPKYKMGIICSVNSFLKISEERSEIKISAGIERF